MDKEFNIFRILSKDDKELIHSAFIKFLINEDIEGFFNQVLGRKPFETENISLEKTYTLKSGDKNRRCRIDIEIQEKEGDEIVVIENKFKSFPYPEQLELYNQIYNENHPNKNILKYVFCFDTDLVKLQKDWQLIGYSEVLLYLHSHKDSFSGDKKMFIQHYYRFLQEYCDKYNNYKNNCKAVFSGSGTKPRYTIEEKFWMNLIYSALRLELQDFFHERDTVVTFRISPGNTSTPLINILPQKWKYGATGKETLIQFQGDLLKFYCHTNDPEFLEIIKLKARTVDSLLADKFKFKPEINSNPKTRYIFQVKLQDLLQNPDHFNVQDLLIVIVDLYQMIDTEIMEPSSSKLQQVTTARRNQLA